MKSGSIILYKPDASSYVSRQLLATCDIDDMGTSKNTTPQFFRFGIRFHRKAPAPEVGTPSTAWRPPNGKSWIRHCVTVPCIST